VDALDFGRDLLVEALLRNAGASPAELLPGLLLAGLVDGAVVAHRALSLNGEVLVLAVLLGLVQVVRGLGLGLAAAVELEAHLAVKLALDHAALVLQVNQGALHLAPSHLPHC